MKRLIKRIAASFTICVIAGNLAGTAEDRTKPRQIEGIPSFDKEYRLGPEDLIEVFVWKEPDLTTTVAVRPDGRISLPLTNELQAGGQTVIQLQGEIIRCLSRYISNPVVNVILKEVKSPKIAVLGEVRKPDVYKMLQKINVLDAIALAGGFTEYAKTDKVTVIRNGPPGFQRIGVNVKRILKEGRGELFTLQPSDVVYVQ